MTIRNALLTLTGAAAIAVAACATSTMHNDIGPSPAMSSTTAAAPTSSGQPAGPSACAEFGGTIDVQQVCKVHTATPTYTIDFTFPVDYRDQGALIELLKHQRDQFTDAVRDQPPRDVPFALEVTGTEYRSGTSGSGTESLVLSEYVNVGGAHPETYYEALNYDLTKGAPSTFATLFKPGADAVAVLDPIVRSELAKRLQGLDIEPNRIGADMYKSFAITDDAVIFFIGQGLWTIEAAGPQQVSVPRSELAAILA
jgi:hypothetical protein